MQKVKRKFKSFQREEPPPEPTYKSPYDKVSVPGYWKKPSPEPPKSKLFEEHRKKLLELFPSLSFETLKIHAMCRITGYRSETHGREVTEGKDYEVTRREAVKIYVINNKGVEMGYPDHWFKTPYRYYNFDVFARCKKYEHGLTREKYYKLLGETGNGYQVINDRGTMQNYGKGLFDFPEKTPKSKSSEKTPIKVPYDDHRKSLLKLFPRLDFDRLKNYVRCHVSAFSMTNGMEYEILNTEETPGCVYYRVVDDLNSEARYPDTWFDVPFKKYDFEVYAKTKDIITPVAGTRPSITRNRYYRLLGETTYGYEIVDDDGKRMNFSKSNFALPITR